MGMIEISENKVGYLREDKYKPPVLYFIGHPNHWNTPDIDELAEEVSSRTEHSSAKVLIILKNKKFPEQRSKEKGFSITEIEG
jgi:hypothetical protein